MTASGAPHSQPVIASQPITLAQWLALNDEIIAISRAGVPIDVGLRSFAEDMPGRLGHLANSASQKLEAGIGMEQVFGDTSTFPPIYRAIIQAGTSTGNLPAALEGLSASLRRIKDVRHWAVAGVIYPSIVVFIWYWVFRFHMLKLWPVASRSWHDFGVQPTWYSQTLDFIASTTGEWWWNLLPVALLAVWIVILIRSVSADWGASPLAGVIPSIRRFSSLLQLATFADLLALLVRHRVPMDEALQIAGDSNADKRIALASRALAERVRLGVVAPATKGVLPSWILWLTTAGLRTDEVADSLQKVAESYRQQAERRGRWITNYFPLALSLFLGGSLLLLNGLITFWPWSKLMFEMSKP